MHITCAKVQWAPIPSKDKNGNDTTSFVKIGVYVEFDDGHVIKCPDGVNRKGRGTIARWSFKHGTWSVQPPDRCKQAKWGYLFVNSLPLWEQADRTRGMNARNFRRQFSRLFVDMCITSAEEVQAA